MISLILKHIANKKEQLTDFLLIKIKGEIRESESQIRSDIYELKARLLRLEKKLP